MSVDVAKQQIEKMIRMESRGWGDQLAALQRIARRYRHLDLTAGALDNVRTGRTKRLFSDVRDAIRLAYLDMCAAEVRKWQEELATERAKGHIDDDLENMEREASDLSARIRSRMEKLGGKR